MTRPGSMAAGLPTPGRALKALLISIAALGIFQALLVQFLPDGQRLFTALACTTQGVLHGEIWRLFTAGLLTSPTNLSHLVFTLIGLYFLAPDLETRWGSWRFVRFFFASIAVGFVLSILGDLFLPAARGFHPPLMFGAAAAITAFAVAWAKAHAEMQVRLFFFLPITGRQFLWITVGFCVLGLIYPMDLPEGELAPFGGLFVGLTSGHMRTLYLRLKLILLRRRVGDFRPLAKAKSARKGGTPNLQMLLGGADDKANKKVPRDKKYLN